jgi:hypothetical protein
MIYERSLPLNLFAKSAICPSAERLLAFSKSLLGLGEAQLVGAHLDQCDFCSAELQLLERFPCKPEAIPVPEMPPGLRLLAESILGNPQRIRSRPLEWHRVIIID